MERISASHGHSGPFGFVYATVVRNHFNLNDADDLRDLTEHNGWSIDQGKILQLDVDSNPTTGYSWSASDDCDGVLTIAKTFVQADNPDGLMGVGGHDEFTLTAGATADSCTFEISYSRSSEYTENVAENHLFSIPITVNPATDCEAGFLGC